MFPSPRAAVACDRFFYGPRIGSEIFKDRALLGVRLTFRKFVEKVDRAVRPTRETCIT